MSQGKKLDSVKFAKFYPNWKCCGQLTVQIAERSCRVLFRNWRYRAEKHGLHGSIRHLGRWNSVSYIRRVPKDTWKTVSVKLSANLSSQKSKCQFLLYISGVGAMEVVAMDMKLRGMYVARQLSFQGVTFKVEKIPLTEEFIRMYDDSVALVSEMKLGTLFYSWSGAQQIPVFLQWNLALKHFHEASYLMGVEAKILKIIWGQFWGAHQVCWPWPFWLQILNAKRDTGRYCTHTTFRHRVA